MKGFKDLFPRGKALIAMAHLPPLPGTPLYDEGAGIQGAIDAIRRDLDILLSADFDSILFCNEGDRPYVLEAGAAGVAAFTRIVTELAPRHMAFGVDFLWDADATLAVATATGASFMREVVTGVYESDMGLWSPDAGRLLRRRRELHALDVLVFMNVTPEFASPIGRRSVGDAARSAVVSSLADAILVSGPMAGAEPDVSAVEEAKDAVGPEVPVLVNTGTKATNVERFLAIADGAIVGSDLKEDGETWAPVSAERVKAFLAAAGR